MADTVSGKKKVYFTRSTGKVYTKDLREPNVGVPPGRFNKKTRGTKAKVAPKDALPDVNW